MTPNQLSAEELESIRTESYGATYPTDFWPSRVTWLLAHIDHLTAQLAEKEREIERKDTSKVSLNDL
jgi:hypothetical protein